jgi:carboxylesterase type B
MPARALAGTIERQIPGLGTVKGLLYDNGVSQYCGIPYARLKKRWTRSTLATSWQDNYHDGTRLGYDSISLTLQYRYH